MPEPKAVAIRVALLLLLVAVAGLTGGCRHLASLRAREVRACPGPLVDTRLVPGDFTLRERVRVNSGDSVWTFQLVTEKRAERLVVVALDPLGVKLFSLTQTGTDTTVDALPPPVLEVPPLNLLSDLHRIHLIGLEPVAPGELERDGTRSGRVGDFEVIETREAGRLATRRFRRGADSRTEVEIRYSPAADTAPARATLDNHHCGYRAEFDILETEGMK